MTLRCYEKIRDCREPWLGRVPSHWKVVKLKHVARVMPSSVDKKSVDGQQGVRLCNYTDVYYNDRLPAEASLMQATATDEQVSRFGLRRGDVIITKDSETADDIAVSMYVPEDKPDVVCGYHLSLLRPAKSLDGLFLKRLFDAVYIKAKVATLANGLTRVGLGIGETGGLHVPLPPLDEQRAIAAFLDSETAKIDGLVAEQRRLIELLKEKRRAVITHAVTKGLNPDAPMKPSGVEWLGEVPEHWSMPPLYTRYEQVLGKMVDASKQTGDFATPYVRNIDVQWDAVKMEGLPLIDIRPSELHRFTLRKGDLLVCEGGDIGRSAIWSGPEDSVAFQKAIHRLRPLIVDENPRYLFFVMRAASAQGAFVAGANPNTIVHLTGDKLRRYRFPKPPLDEQRAITAILDLETAKIDGLVEQAEAAIELLQERRTALISAAVTGKIDVREHASQEVA